MKLKYNDRVEALVEDFNRFSKSVLFNGEAQVNGEFYFSFEKINDRNYFAAILFKEDDLELDVVRLNYEFHYDTKEDFDSIRESCLKIFFTEIFRWLLFSSDSIGLCVKSLPGNPIYISENTLTINTLFKEGLKQLKTNKTT